MKRELAAAAKKDRALRGTLNEAHLELMKHRAETIERLGVSPVEYAKAVGISLIVLNRSVEAWRIRDADPRVA